MTNEKVIERLKQGNWVIETATNKGLLNVIKYAELAELKWALGLNPARKFNDIKNESTFVFFEHDDTQLWWSDDYEDFPNKVENITDWFFKNVNGDDMENNVYVTAGKYELPESEKNIKYCNSYPTIEIAIQDIIDKQLTDYPFCEIEVDNKVISIRGIEIKPKQTPLPIPDKLWKYINYSFKYITMDEDRDLWVWEEIPEVVEDEDGGTWGTNYGETFNLNRISNNINTDGIDWRLSLTKRPEGL